MNPRKTNLIVSILSGAAFILILGAESMAVPQLDSTDSNLKLDLSVRTPQKPQEILSFVVTLENVGEADLILNLGWMNANGKRQIPEAIIFSLTDSSGISKEGHYFYWSPSVRMDDYVVPLRAGSTYSLRISMDRIMWSGEQQPRPNLSSGEYRIRADFKGNGAEHADRNDTISLMKFWKGRLKSKEISFKIG